MVERSQERGEASGRVESRKTEPVDRTVAPNQGCGLAVPDQRVVLDARRHLVLFNNSEAQRQAVRSSTLRHRHGEVKGYLDFRRTRSVTQK